MSVFSSLMPAAPEIDFDITAPPGVSENLGVVLGWLSWAGIVAGVIGLIVAGILIAIDNEGGPGRADIVKRVGLPCLGVLIVCAAPQLISMFS